MCIHYVSLVKYHQLTLRLLSRYQPSSTRYTTSSDITICMRKYRAGLFYDDKLIQNGLQSSKNDSQSLAHQCMAITSALWFLDSHNAIFEAFVINPSPWGRVYYLSLSLSLSLSLAATWEDVKWVIRTIWHSCRPASAWNDVSVSARVDLFFSIHNILSLLIHNI